MLNKTDWLEKSKDETRTLTKPFYKDGFKVYCNGYILLAEPAQGEPDTKGTPGVLKYLTGNDELSFQPVRVELPEAEMCSCAACFGFGKGARTRCEECNGDGEVIAETDYNEYEVECKTCGGDGDRFVHGTEDICEACNGSGKEESKYQPIPILGIHVARRYLKMICGIEDVEYAVQGDPRVLRWRSKRENCFGVIMPMNI